MWNLGNGRDLDGRSTRCGLHFDFRSCCFLGRSLLRRCLLGRYFVTFATLDGCLHCSFLGWSLLCHLGLFGLKIANESKSLSLAFEHRNERLDESGLRSFRRHVVVFAEIQHFGIRHAEFLR